MFSILIIATRNKNKVREFRDERLERAPAGALAFGGRVLPGAPVTGYPPPKYLNSPESPVFKKIKEEGKTSKAPLTDSFLRYPNNKYALLSAMRAVNQIISYDLPFIFAALTPVLLAGSTVGQIGMIPRDAEEMEDHLRPPGSVSTYKVAVPWP